MRETSADVIIIGGGASGLAAAGEIGRAGFSVIVLEARERLGGRVCTERRAGWPGPIELGAEFIHDGNAALWKLIRSHRIGVRRVPAHHWLARDRALEKMKADERLGRVTQKIDPRKIGRRSFADFLRAHGKEFSAVEREVAGAFVEGFEAAPMDEMSARAIAGETLGHSRQFSIPRGYDNVIAALIDELPPARVALRTSAIVQAIEWRRGAVVVRTRVERFSAVAAIVALPLGVLQARPPARGAVRFEPQLREKEKLLARMRMGHVIRITLRLERRAWRRLLPPELRPWARGGFGFIHSRVAGVPVWWSSGSASRITGWAGGPAAIALAGRSRCGVREKALSSLSRVWRVRKKELARAVKDFALHNWSRDPFSRGAYSFLVAGLDDAPRRLRTPVRDTLFFAGEATADGAAIGTVHGAIASGLRAASEAGAALKRARKAPMAGHRKSAARK